MSPDSTGVDATIALPTLESVGPSALPGAPADLPRPLLVAIGALVVTLAVGAVLLARFPGTTRRIADDVDRRPDLAFAAGFVVFFGLLVAVALPLIGSTYLEVPALTTLASIVSLPGLLLWGALLVVGGTIGAIVLGSRIAAGLGVESPSRSRGLAIGAVAACAALAIPVLGALVAMGLATVAIGADARRRFDLDGRLGIGDRPTPEPTATAASGSAAAGRRSDRSRGLEDRRENGPGADVWESGAERSDDPASGRTAAVTKRATDADGVDSDGPRGDGSDGGDGGRANGDESRPDDDASRTDEEWTVDDWEWDTETDAADDGDRRAERDDS